jgi:hypothetical protein
MLFFEKPKGKKVHTRSIEVHTYEYNERRLIVEGSLTDHRFQEYHLVTGEKKPPGIIHQMFIRLLVDNSTLEIEDVQVEMPSVPREECLETIDSIAPVKGLTIAGGFTSKVKKLAGGNRGCSHMVALLTAMAPAAVQGYAAYQSQKPSGFASNSAIVVQFLVNTCWPWREDGPLVKEHRRR